MEVEIEFRQELYKQFEGNKRVLIPKEDYCKTISNLFHLLAKFHYKNPTKSQRQQVIPPQYQVKDFQQPVNRLVKYIYYPTQT